MFTCTRRLSFDAGHRVLGHGGKCRYLHGHRYDVDVTCYANKLNPLGMVVDFGIIKEKVGAWIDTHLDHNMILCRGDPLLLPLYYSNGKADDLFGGKDPHIMEGNPTAENIAILLFSVSTNLLPPEIIVQSVRVYETPNCWADYPGPPVEGVKA